jgi:hypothetical protein
MRRIVPAVLGLFLVVAACGDDDAAPTTVTTGTTTAITTPTTGTTVVDTPASIVDDRAVVIVVAVGSAGLDLLVEGALAEPGSRIQVDVGAAVHIVFSGSVAEELHVHGYDLALELAPGGVEVLDFTADIPGIFEVELEGSGTLVFELEVS